MNKALHAWLALCAALLLMMTSMPALGADALTQGLVQVGSITGNCRRPESADASQVSFSVAYSYPQFAAQFPADEAINRYYRQLAENVTADGWEGDTGITCEVTHSSERYVSVLETATVQGGNGESQTLRSDTFARDGIYAGQKIGLSQLLGLEEQSALAGTLAYELVWQMVAHEAQNADSDYLDGLTREQVEHSFQPETDYYLDADGNIVFWIASGEIAGEVAGILRFPFAPAELLSAF